MIAPSVQEFFIDKLTGLPMAAGKVFFYSDVDRNVLKPIYALSGSPPNYSYVQLPNPVTLTAVGTFSDSQGNDVLPYYYPFDDEGNVELYYIAVYNSSMTPQFTRQAYPNIAGLGQGSGVDLTNYASNGQFLAHTNVDTTGNIVLGGDTAVAPGGWYYQIPIGSTAQDSVTFGTLPAGPSPLGYPRFYIDIKNISGGSGDAYKYLSLRFPGVSTFAGQTLNFHFTARAIGAPVNISIAEVQYFGGTGSTIGTTNTTAFAGTSTVIGTAGFAIYPTSSNITFVADTSTSIGTNNDDYIEIVIVLPIATPFEIQMTDFVLTPTLGSTAYPNQTSYDVMSEGVAGSLPIPDPAGMDLYLPIIYTQSGFSYDNSAVGAIVNKTQAPTNVSFGVGNELLMNGATYLANAYSPIGVPYQRLMNYLLKNSASVSITQSGLTATIDDGQVPMYGTGSNFVTLFNNAGASTTSFFVQINTVSTGSASDGATPTGWTFTATVANTTYTVSNVTAPSGGQYWTFTEGATGKVYNVWYSVNGSGTAPATPSGANIKVSLTGTPTSTSTIAATLAAINQYQFMILDTRGYFWRGLDTSGTIDLDASARALTGIVFDTTSSTGAHLASFEQQAFLNHSHNIPTGNSVSGTSFLANEAFLANGSTGTSPQGGDETRPINLATYWYIKY